MVAPPSRLPDFGKLAALPAAAPRWLAGPELSGQAPRWPGWVESQGRLSTFHPAPYRIAEPR